MTERELGYVAATIDCEGYIAISKTKQRRNGRTGHWGLRVTVTNSDLRLANWLTETVGGRPYGPYQNKVKGSDPNRPDYGRPWWSWEIRSRAAAEMLQDILPLMVIKRDQAEVAIQFARTLGHQRGSLPLPVEVEQTRIQLSDNLLRIRAVGGG
jgi:hypothetical protein